MICLIGFQMIGRRKKMRKRTRVTRRRNRRSRRRKRKRRRRKRKRRSRRGEKKMIKREMRRKSCTSPVSFFDVNSFWKRAKNALLCSTPVRQH
jgi:hypothetical protein